MLPPSDVMDPLSDVLALLKPRSHMAGGFDVGEPWSIRFDRYEGVKCYGAVAGACWLEIEGGDEPTRLTTGDYFILPRGLPFRLASDLEATPVDAKTVFSTPANGALRVFNGGGDCMIAGGHFALDGNHAGLLLGVLPPVVHIRQDADKAKLRWCLDQMRHELREPRPGGSLVVQQLATMMLVQALRLHLADGSKDGVGWMFALADKRLGAAIGAIHADPARRWTLQALAERAGMSRSTFALRFKQKVGKSPMEYATQWRMRLAADRLANARDPVSVVALSLGYESESAFSVAFRRTMGCSPRRYARGEEKRVAPSAVAA
jgi:AraC-like DNA-binding protein